MATINDKRVSIVHFGSPAGSKFESDPREDALQNLKSAGWIERDKDKK